ncbi:MAG: hypothetical protein QOJ29_5232 [Thermoleophilaceae bacterium]|nr:hypothetical protein [Thermoleophilaceae bacterium]
MRRLVVVAAAACLLALASAESASADAPGCFGAWTSNFAHNPVTGDHGLGAGLVPYVQADGAFGRTWLPAFKFVACVGT